MTYEFEVWYEELQEIAHSHNANVSDHEAWNEEFDTGKTAHEAFYSEYPELLK